MSAADGAPGTDQDAAGPELARVIIELDRLEDPISGFVCAGPRQPQRFRGWTGLLAALQSALGPPAR
jgi:hypothetical protein